MFRFLVATCLLTVSISVLFSCTHTPQKEISSTVFPIEIAPYVKNWDERKLAALSQYKIIGTCGGFPRINVKTAPGFCVGLIDNGENMVFPRTAAEIAPGKILVVDMGGWAPNNGKLYLLTLTNGKYVRTTVFDAAKSTDKILKKIFDRPHLITKGPDGLYYLGSVSQIVRFDASKPDFIKRMDIVVDNIPNQGLHPLKMFTFDNTGNIYINVGSATNVCQKSGIAFAKNASCLEAEDNNIGQAQVRKYTRLADGKYSKDFKIYAKGLRNSMGLWWHKEKNILIQAENGRDNIKDLDPQLSNANLPHEEINILQEGSNYGWPYCYDNNLVNPEWSYVSCDKMTKPYYLLPAHSSPLSILIYNGSQFPAWYQNRMLISLHGYEPLGHRIIALRRDDNGLPTKEPMSVVYGWNADGTQNLGSPVGLTQMSDGSVLIVEDKSRKVLRLFYDVKAGNGTPIVEIPDKVMEDIAGDQKLAQLKTKLATALSSPNPPIFAQVQSKMIDTNCVGCHTGADARGLELSPYDFEGNEARILSHSKGRQILAHLKGDGFLLMPPDGFKDATETKQMIDLYTKWLTSKGL